MRYWEGWSLNNGWAPNCSDVGAAQTHTQQKLLSLSTEGSLYRGLFVEFRKCEKMLLSVLYVHSAFSSSNGFVL